MTTVTNSVYQTEGSAVRQNINVRTSLFVKYLGDKPIATCLDHS